MANFIQRPRLFNPADAYQEGRANRIQDDMNQLTGDVNAFRFQQEKQMAPIKNQAELVKLKTDFQKLGAAEQKQALEIANRVRSGIGVYLKNPDPKEYAAFRAAVSVHAPDNELPPNYDLAGIQLARQKLDWELGEIEKEYGAPVAGLNALGKPEFRRFDPTGDSQVVEGFRPRPQKPLVQVGPSAQPPTIPQPLLSGLSTPVAERASAAYTAAGGGKDGLVAANKEISKGTTQERRRSSANILKTAFPKASPAELQQMQGSMDAAKDNQAGLKEATKVREEQRRLKKAKGFQERAVILLDKILSNPELNDVLGSVEGSDKGYLYGEKYRSDLEAEAIADIEEAQNILTSDNLKLMSGVLSETDIKILTNLAGGALNRARGESRFRSDVTTLKDKLSSQLVQTVDDRKSVDPSGRQDGKLHVDAQGNRAWVYPDGSYKEVE